MVHAWNRHGADAAERAGRPQTDRRTALDRLVFLELNHIVTNRVEVGEGADIPFVLFDDSRSTGAARAVLMPLSETPKLPLTAARLDQRSHARKHESKCQP
jgi:hypothetical protein